jgi:serine/threonine protein kinase
MDLHASIMDSPNAVRVKLGDYGISRTSLPTGTKGFGGTEGYMAPEILQFNGEEEYTEKVDCFSFGMFLYELITLKQPFEGSDSVKESILEGGRPPVTNRVREDIVNDLAQFFSRNRSVQIFDSRRFVILD